MKFYISIGGDDAKDCEVGIVPTQESRSTIWLLRGIELAFLRPHYVLIFFRRGQMLWPTAQLNSTSIAAWPHRDRRKSAGAATRSKPIRQSCDAARKNSRATALQLHRRLGPRVQQRRDI